LVEEASPELAKAIQSAGTRICFDPGLEKKEAWGSFQQNIIRLHPSLLDESPYVRAVVLAHECFHAKVQNQNLSLGEEEYQAFQAMIAVWKKLKEKYHVEDERLDNLEKMIESLPKERFIDYLRKELGYSFE